MNKVNRYDSPEWKELVAIQNMLPQTDILTITAFMDDSQFINHLNHNKKRVEKHNEKRTNYN